MLNFKKFLNPGGSVKDRVAAKSKATFDRKMLLTCGIVIDNAEEKGLLVPHRGYRIFEGTVGSTGISIATLAAARYAISLLECL